MHLKARRIKPGAVLTADVCIVGAGAAGTVMAHDLGAAGVRVILIEAGGLKGEGGSLALYRGETTDPKTHTLPDQDRARGVGGSSAMWGGRCMPYDPVDFEERGHVPFSGWPVTHQEIEPWFRKAQVLAECGDYNYDATASGLDGDLIDGLRSDHLRMDTLERWSPPTNFGRKLGPSLVESKNVTLVTGAAVVGIMTSGDRQRVTDLDVRSVRSKHAFRVQADRFVLSGGGLETTRLLLASAGAGQPAIGDHSGWLGRGYMCHIGGVISRLILTEGSRVVFGYEQDRDGVFVRRRFTLSEEVQKAEGLPNIYALLDRPLLDDASHGSAALSALYLVKRLVQRQSGDAVSESTGTLAMYKRHIRNLFMGAPEVLTVLPRYGRQRFLQGRRVPSLLLASQDNSFYLYFHAEQMPDRDSRVMLSDEADALGLPRLRIDARMTPRDVDGILAAHKVIDRELRASGAGRLEFLNDDTRSAIRSSKFTLGHHIGTTRMSADPADGVVDENARVHGTQNLFVASSSAFPTSSQAHPTLTILAFALRLSDHIKNLQSEGRS